MYNKIVNNIIKILIVCILCISLFIISFFIVPPVFAAGTISPLPVNTYYRIDTYDGSPRYVNSPIDNLFVFGAPVDGNTNNALTWVYLYSGSYSILRSSDGINNDLGTYSISFQDNYFNSEYSLYYKQQGTLFTSDYLPTFSSVEEGIAAVYDYLNTPTSVPSLYEGLSIPPGYYARISVSNGSSFVLNSDLNFRIPNTFGSSVYNQKYIFNDNADPNNVPTNSAITINWNTSGNLDVFGQTNKAAYPLNSTISSYIWIINPQYSNYRNSGAGSIIETPRLNNNITLSDVYNVDQIRLYAMSAGFGSSPGSYGNIDYSVSSDDEYIAAIASDGSIYYTNSNGDIVTPPDYGNTPVQSTPSSLIQQFENLLNNLVSSIERLLIAPIDYINRLIASANNFFAWLKGLWSWLPSPVVEAITAVLIIMCTVGALKLLWR